MVAKIKNFIVEQPKKTALYTLVALFAVFVFVKIRKRVKINKFKKV